MSVILDAVLESFIPGCGWIPLYSFDPHMVTDHHARCNIYNYPDNQLNSGKYGTIQAIRRPWDAYLVAQALSFIETMNKDIFFYKNTHVLQDEFLIQIKMTQSLCCTVLPVQRSFVTVIHPVFGWCWADWAAHTQMVGSFC